MNKYVNGRLWFRGGWCYRQDQWFLGKDVKGYPFQELEDFCEVYDYEENMYYSFGPSCVI